MAKLKLKKLGKMKSKPTTVVKPAKQATSNKRSAPTKQVKEPQQKLKQVHNAPKKSISLRIDQDIYDALTENYSPYQTQINTVLREFLKEEGHL